MSEEASEPNKPVEKKKGKGKLVGILVALALILGAGAAGAVLAPKYLGGAQADAKAPAHGDEETAEGEDSEGHDAEAEGEEGKDAEEGSKKSKKGEPTADEAAKTPEVALKYGSFINEVISFVIVAFCVFLLVKAINRLKRQAEQKPETAPVPPAQDIVLLTEIRDLLKRNA